MELSILDSGDLRVNGFGCTPVWLFISWFLLYVLCMLLESCMGDGELEVLEGEAQDVVQPLLAITRKSRSHTDVHSAKSRRVCYLDVVHRCTIPNIVIQWNIFRGAYLLHQTINQSTSIVPLSLCRKCQWRTENNLEETGQTRQVCSYTGAERWHRVSHGGFRCLEVHRSTAVWNDNCGWITQPRATHCRAVDCQRPLADVQLQILVLLSASASDF